MLWRRTLYILFSILGLFLLGTVVVLSSVSYYLAIDARAYLTELEVPVLDNVTRWNATEHGKTERIPRILHQTWKTEILPMRWRGISQGCRDMMPDYEYMLWTDASSREFIAEHYPWFLGTFNDYTYPIQRADAIRYFILHHFGGVYLDLDVGCLRPLDPLLIFPVVLPKTIPVGISNDLMFSEKGHAFLAQTIHNLVTFDHSWVLNYPTVMFSTGPMFLSAQYGLYTSSHPESTSQEVRILPKSMYGKNAKPGEAPHSFFSHFYGSSWHADDAAFIGFLGKWGKGLMWVGLVVLIIGLGRLALSSNRQRKYSLRRIGGYDVLLPKWTQRNGRWYLDLGWFTLPGTISQPTSPTPGSPTEENVAFLPLDGRTSSPAPSEVSTSTDAMLNGRPFPLFDAVRRAGHRAVASLSGPWDSGEGPRRRGRHGGSRGVLFFLPAIFTQTQEIELSESYRSSPPGRTPFQRTVSRASPLPPEKQQYAKDIERAGLFGDDFSKDAQCDTFSSGTLPRQASDTDCPTPSTLVEVSEGQSSRHSFSSSRPS